MVPREQTASIGAMAKMRLLGDTRSALTTLSYVVRNTIKRLTHFEWGTMSDNPEIKFRNIAIAWIGFLVVAYITAGSFMTSTLLEERRSASLRHQARFDPDLVEFGKTGTETQVFDLGREPDNIVVEAGIYVDRVFNMSVRDDVWGVDFYIWFRWTNGKGHPGENFQVVDGVIKSKRLEAKYLDLEADRTYELYRVNAEITKFFGTTRFPRDDHLLTIKIEDAVHRNYDLRYVPDVEGSNLSSRVEFPGFVNYRTDLVVKDHSYKTRRGDPRLPHDYKATHSQLIYGIWIERPDWGLYIKMFIGIFSSMSIALLAFFISPGHVDPRFGVGIGSFFAGVANTYIISLQIPETSDIGLTDFVTSTILVTILLTMISSVISVTLFNKFERPDLNRLFDTATFAVFLTCIVTLMVTMAVTASI